MRARKKTLVTYERLTKSVRAEWIVKATENKENLYGCNICDYDFYCFKNINEVVKEIKEMLTYRGHEREDFEKFIEMSEDERYLYFFDKLTNSEEIKEVSEESKKVNKMKMTTREKAIKRYNKIMCAIGYDHVTIGTEDSEMYDENTPIQTMVDECEYWLSTYYEDGHSNREMKYEDKEGYKLWVSETGKLKRFIKAYKGVEDEITEEQRKEKEQFSTKLEEIKDELYNLALEGHEKSGISVDETLKKELQTQVNTAFNSLSKHSFKMECSEERTKSETEPVTPAPKTQKQKVQERIDKNTIKLEKQKKNLEKLELKKSDYEQKYDLSIPWYTLPLGSEERYIGINYDHLLDDIRRKEKQIKKTEELILRQTEQLKKAKDEPTESVKREHFFLNMPKLPDILIELRSDLEQEILEILREENRRETRERFKRDDESLKNDAKYSADFLVKEVWFKIFDKTGNLIDCFAYTRGGHLNGTFNGEKGSVHVQTVLAGGYNIQCLHMRILVHEIK